MEESAVNLNRREHSSPKIKQSRWPLLISGLLLAGLLIAYFAIPAVQDFADQAFEVITSRNEERITQWIDQLGIWGPLCIIFAMIVQMFLIVVPSPLLMLVAILAYGPVWGTILSIAAVLIASSVGYAIGHFLSDITVKKIVGEQQLEKVERQVDNYGAWAVIITRLVPFLSNDAISFVGGILGMGYGKFIVATAVGITPLAILLAYFGENNDRLTNGLLWISGLSLLVFIVYMLMKRQRQHKPT